MSSQELKTKASNNEFTFGEVAGKVMELLEKEDMDKLDTKRKISDPNNRMSLANHLFKRCSEIEGFSEQRNKISQLNIEDFEEKDTPKEFETGNRITNF